MVTEVSVVERQDEPKRNAGTALTHGLPDGVRRDPVGRRRMNPMTGTQDAAQTDTARSVGDTNRRRGRRFGSLILAAVGALALAGGTTGVAHASGFAPRVPLHCVPEGSWGMYGTGYTWVGIPTSLYSSAKSGGGSITYDQSSAVDVGMTLSASATANAGVIFASVSATVGISVSASVAHTQGWQYSFPVPNNGLKYYVQNWHKGLRLQVGFDQLNSACQDSWSEISTAYLPISSTSTGAYQFTLVQGSNGPAKCCEIW